MPIAFKGAAGSDAAEITIYDNIGEHFWGEGVTADWFYEQLRSYDDRKHITIRINSRGGDVDDGIAIYNLVMRHPGRKTVEVDGICASIASVIAMAGDVIRMGTGTRMMIHNAWTIAAGNHKQFRAMADRLERFSGQMAEIYANRTGRAVKDVQRMMDAEKEMTAKEAISEKFADEMSSDVVRMAAFAGSLQSPHGQLRMAQFATGLPLKTAASPGPKRAALMERIAASRR